MYIIHNLATAENYYRFMLAKDFDQMATYLHDDVHFISPLSEMRDKEAVIAAAQGFGAVLQEISIRSRFASGNQIMFAYNMTLPAPVGQFPAAVMMDFTNRLISRIELFYDTRPFQPTQ